MQFINNWRRTVSLSAVDAAATLDLPDGKYRLTITDGDAFEIVDADVSDGVAQLVRGLEGTEATDWPAGSVIYASVTAAMFMQLSGLSGSGDPNGAVTGSTGGIYVDLDSGSSWICELGNVWRQLAYADPIGVVGGTADFFYPVSVDQLIESGTEVTFHAATVYSNIPVSGSPPSFTAAQPMHLSVRPTLTGAMAVIATPVTEYSE